jgi:hypothetical protein
VKVFLKINLEKSKMILKVEVRVSRFADIAMYFLVL